MSSACAAYYAWRRSFYYSYVSKRWKESHPEQKIGILQFDTHFDLRSLEDNGPSNGTPIRNLIESNTIDAAHVWNIGLHGFYNSKLLKEYADSKGVHYVTLLQARKAGINHTVKEALKQLSKEVEHDLFNQLIWTC